MTLTQLKAKIKKKFGSYSNFARAAKIDRTTLQNDFLLKKSVTKDKINEINSICDGTEDFTLGRVLTQEELALLRDIIRAKGGVPAFCEANPEFTTPTVYRIIWGDKVITKTTKRLFEVLNIKLQTNGEETA